MNGLGGANLSDPEVLRAFRRRLATFLQLCSAALGGGTGGLVRTKDWLQGEQHAHWKDQIRRRDEAYETARRAWLESEADVRAGRHGRSAGKQSSFDERRAMDRALRSREEAEAKLTAVRRWIMRLEHDGEPLLHQCRDHDLFLREHGGKALVRLDHLIKQVEAYLELPASAGAGMPPAPTGSRPEATATGGAP
jgi:hypothetical protein